jgi:hypothetical protein
MISVYPGNQKGMSAVCCSRTSKTAVKFSDLYSGFPFPAFGSYEALDLDGDVCTDRCSRYNIYGHDEVSPAAGCASSVRIDWKGVDWGGLQFDCVTRNSNRYKISDSPSPAILLRPDARPPSVQRSKTVPSLRPTPQPHHRTAVLVRSWHTMEWTPNHEQYLRSLIMELSLHSGGEYEIFLLVHVKDPEYQLNGASDVQLLKDKYIPVEFHNITVLFNTETLERWYPKVPEHRYAWSEKYVIPY